VLLRTRVAFSLPSVGAFDRGSDPAKYPSLAFQNSSRIFVPPPEVTLLNKLVFENLKTRCTNRTAGEKTGETSFMVS
jgi:hypothetical protein